MLTPDEVRATRAELQENYRRLAPKREDVLADTLLSSEELDRVLEMNDPDPSDVWMMRDYLEDKLGEAGIEIFPWSRLADHAANRWFPYDTPWRDARRRRP